MEYEIKGVPEDQAEIIVYENDSEEAVTCEIN
jgi:hypothetical protein